MNRSILIIQSSKMRCFPVWDRDTSKNRCLCSGLHGVASQNIKMLSSYCLWKRKFCSDVKWHVNWKRQKCCPSCVCVCVCVFVCVCVCVCTLCIFFKTFLHNIKQVNENTWTVTIKKTDSIKPTFVIRTEMTRRQFRIDSQRAMHLLKVIYMH
jgi:hypothetical protein